eukprot:7985881-Alexandrium_andersonii.AAC.1
MLAGRCALRAWPPVQAPSAKKRCTRQAWPRVQATSANCWHWLRVRLLRRMGRRGSSPMPPLLTQNVACGQTRPRATARWRRGPKMRR